MQRLRIRLIILVMMMIVLTGTASASFYYEIGEQLETLTINPNGTVELVKEFSFHVLPSSTEDGTEVWVGLPTDDTRVIRASYELLGQSYPVDYRVKENDDEQHLIFSNFQAIRPGETGRFTFTATISDLIYWYNRGQLKKDPMEQLVNISYVPAYWDDAVVKKLQLELFFIGELPQSALQFPQNVPDLYHPMIQKTRLVWEYNNLRPGAKVKHAVVFPRQYLAANFNPKKDWMPTWAIVLIIICVGGGLLAAAWAIYYSIKNKRYQTPVAYMKGDKAYTNFDPVEAAFFYNLPVDLISKLIIMGLVDKNVVQIKEDDSLKRVPTLKNLTWYEELFLESVDENLKINPDQWKENYAEMLSKFYEKIEGYCGRQTMAYYNKRFKGEAFGSEDDPRWSILQKHLADGILDKKDREELQQSMPAYTNSYLPIFYLTVINSRLAQESQNQYKNVFPGAYGAGSSGGGSGSCACACACACASSGGCT